MQTYNVTCSIISTFDTPALASSPKGLFALRRLTLVVAAATFLSACGVMQNPAGSESDEGDLERTIENRSAGARVSIRPDVSVVEEEVFDTVWDRISNGLELSHAHDNERIDSQIAFYQENTELLKTVSERANFFLFEIVEELERREMPMELALLPIIESGYNPNASGYMNTVGLWQIIANTGRSLGLKQDWWYDGRRDPIASTSAALDYLQSLHQMFDGDWLLALAAYNSGQGTVRNAMEQNSRNSRATDYWSLNLPAVTEEYVPRLIALSRLVSDPKNYGLELADIKNERVVTQVETGSQIDLSLAAEIAGLEPELLYQLNPGFRQWATHPDGPHALVLPITHVENFTAALATLDEQSRVTWDRYVVQPGDTLGKIANQFRTQVAALQQANDIEGSRIIAGESLLIPRAYNAGLPLKTPNAPQYVPGVASTSGEVTGQPAPTRYEVRSGDSLWRIASRYNLTTAALARWNDMDESAVLRPGQVLSLADDSALAQVDQDTDRTTTYRVRAGDSLARIARQFGVGIAELAAWNNIAVADLIHPGQQLVVRPGESEIN